MCGESWARKRLFNPPPQFSRLGIQCPSMLSSKCVLCFYIGFVCLRVKVVSFFLFSFLVSLIGWYAIYNNFMHSNTFHLVMEVHQMSKSVPRVDNDYSTETLSLVPRPIPTYAICACAVKKGGGGGCKGKGLGTRLILDGSWNDQFVVKTT